MTDRPDATGQRAEHAPGGRGEGVARLASMLATFATAGDFEGARAMLEAIGRLLPSPTARGEGAAVVDLDAERQRRAGQ